MSSIPTRNSKTDFGRWAIHAAVSESIASLHHRWRRSSRITNRPLAQLSAGQETCWPTGKIQRQRILGPFVPKLLGSHLQSGGMYTGIYMKIPY